MQLTSQLVAATIGFCLDALQHWPNPVVSRVHGVCAAQRIRLHNLYLVALFSRSPLLAQAPLTMHLQHVLQAAACG